jgi:hypothetical protein
MLDTNLFVLFRVCSVHKFETSVSPFNLCVQQTLNTPNGFVTIIYCLKSVEFGYKYINCSNACTCSDFDL